MKHFRTIFTFASAIFLFTSCGQKTDDKDPTSIGTKIVTLADIGLSSTATPIDSMTFHTWHNAWENNSVAYMNAPMNPTWTNARMSFFDVPVADLDSLMQLSPNTTRFYLGLQDTISSDYPSGYKAHLLLVSVDANGVLDMSHIYDYTTPCPPRCPK